MKLVSVASAVPETVETNREVEARLKLEPGWIERRSGILQRPKAPPDIATSDVAIQAGSLALERAGLRREDIALLLLATSTPDHLLPPTAPLVAFRLGLKQAGAIDLAGACAGFLYALILADSYGQSLGKHVMVIAANVLSRRLNSQDPATAALFSDGAGAVILAPSQPSRFLGSYLAADGSSYESIGISAGGSREPMTPDAVNEGRHLMTMRRGAGLFKDAVHAMARAGQETLIQSGITAGAIDWWIPHQANARIIQDTGKLLGISPERTISVVSQVGNSSAATIPIALDLATREGKIQPGNLLLFTAAGAGLLSAGLVMRG